MYNYLSNMFFYFFLGALWGVIDAWKRKLMFIIWILLVVLVLIVGFVSGTGNLTSDLAWYLWIYQLFWFIFGNFSGRMMYKETFK